MSPERTADGRWIVVRGRRWRAADPELPEQVRAELQRHLGRARAAVRTGRAADDPDAVRAARRRVALAKHGLGERGEPWWEQDPDTRERRWTEALEALEAPDAAAEGLR
ncbi:hypothetical protein ACFQH9_11245 [Pseudonocardia lutea]|uniref:Biopolymer transporter Tol n=1 Tax=Pseudonocardia lutea TaxID=2172015 RepID=A0ABW1I587_9PSEU